MLTNRLRENQLAYMSLDEELCGAGTSWLCATTRSYYWSYLKWPHYMKKCLPKKAETPQVMMIKGGKIQKAKKKSLKAKGKHPAKDDTCHHCKEVGHCKRNFPTYLAELIKKKKVGTASSLDVFIIELFSFPTKSWLYDTSCGTHICNTKHGLGGVRKAETSRSY
ncbi:zinc finger, CCHC-type containing protein [Tanacetum coccineum]